MRRFYEPYKLSPLQKLALFPYFSINAFIDPTKGDMVAGLGDLTAPIVLPKLHKLMLNNEEGRKILSQKPLISEATLNVEKLRILQKGTLGREYMHYMDSHGFSSNERSTVKFMMDPEMAYVMTRYRQIHDFWHVLSGLEPSILGELALKAFEFRVTNLPICMLSVLFGQFRLSNEEKFRLWNEFIPWAERAGALCRDRIMTYEYENHLEKNVEQVRDELSFIPAPKLDS